MIKRLLLGAACAALVALAACGGNAPVGTTQNTDLSPREEAREVMNAYTLLLTLADGAEATGKLGDKAVIKIGDVSEAATDAEKAYVAEAKKCWRDSNTGVVGDAPGLAEGDHCEPSTVKRLLSVFTSRTGALEGALDAFGIDTSKVGAF